MDLFVIHQRPRHIKNLLSKADKQVMEREMNYEFHGRNRKPMKRQTEININTTHKSVFKKEVTTPKGRTYLRTVKLVYQEMDDSESSVNQKLHDPLHFTITPTGSTNHKLSRVQKPKVDQERLFTGFISANS